MTLPKLTYFDAPASRGEECRLALHVAGVPFEDVRIKGADWPALKPKTPFGSVPFLELPDGRMLAQSNAILVFIGRRHGVHPKDDLEAATHEAILQYCEELRVTLAPSLRISDPEAKKKAREDLAADYLPRWAAAVERQIKSGPFFGGDTLNVVDIKLYMIVRWFVSGVVDHIPATVFGDFPKLNRVHDSVRDDARIKAWYAR